MEEVAAIQSTMPMRSFCSQRIATNGADFTEKVFGPMSHAHHTQLASDVYEYPDTIAIATSDADTTNVCRTNICRHFTANLMVDLTSTLNAKRINSTGDSDHSSSTITSSFSKKQKIVCALCGTVLAAKNSASCYSMRKLCDDEQVRSCCSSDS